MFYDFISLWHSYCVNEPKVEFGQIVEWSSGQIVKTIQRFNYLTKSDSIRTKKEE